MQLNMTADVEDLRDFHVALDALFNRIHKRIGVEHCKIKLENYIGILFY